MSRIRAAILCLLALSLALEAGAQSAAPPAKGILVEGYGIGMRKTCGAFVRETSEQDGNKLLEHDGKQYYFEHRLYFEWLSGFFTARSFYARAGTVKNTDMNDMLTWIRKYCEAHPLDDFLTAADKLVAEVSKP